MTEKFSKSELQLLEAIAATFSPQQGKRIPPEEVEELHEMVILAAHHSVLPVLQGQLKDYPLTKEDRGLISDACRLTAVEFYQLLFDARNILNLLSDGGICAVLLKGASVARFYPVPEERRSSDVDVLLADPGEAKRAAELLKAHGCRQLEADYEANHHIRFGLPDHHILELHVSLVEPFAEKKINRYIESRYRLKSEDIRSAEIMRIKLPVLDEARCAFHLLLHMLMDFLRHGFGLKLLCDWVAFWNRKVETESVETFLKDVSQCGLEGFLSVVTTTCVKYLGLRTDGQGTLRINKGQFVYEGGIFGSIKPDSVCDEFMCDVLETEREGIPKSDRMVAMRSTGVRGLIKEFHHQTVLYHPKAARTVILLPVLYVMVFFGFLRNNKRIRGGQSVLGVVKTADQRSRLVKKIL